MVDIHCHLLYGVDDGSQSYDESEAMLKAAQNAGIDAIVCTPHCRFSDFDAALVRERYEELTDLADSFGIGLALGYEVYWKKLIELGVDQASTFKFNCDNHFMLEFSSGALPNNWERIVYNIQAQGLDVVIAHPERYSPIQKDIDIAYELKEAGCELQLSANFVEGGMFDKRKKTAIKLLKEDLVDYVASDAHSAKDYDYMYEAMRLVEKYR